MDVNSREFYGKQKRDKRGLVPDSATDVSDHPVKEVLEAAIARTIKDHPDLAEFFDYPPQDWADRMITHMRTIVSKAYTELFGETTTRRLHFTDDEARVFMDWFIDTTFDHLARIPDLVLEHRNLLRESLEEE